jgi:hypothetical protein
MRFVPCLSQPPVESTEIRILTVVNSDMRALHEDPPQIAVAFLTDTGLSPRVTRV